ncbi:MAG: tyrosine-type recombinase/integrase [Deltaproteobacteria bacterium]|nr:tyrosine-type recombinase/integrase [Deltaproteobacteria bacterium]
MGLFKRGQTWWMRFTFKGRQIRESTETEDKKLAERIYHKILGEIAEGKWFEKFQERDFKEMMEKYMNEHSIPKKASSERDRSSLTHLLPFFGDYSLSHVTPKVINVYKTTRRNEGASPCTINRELALMKHAFNLAIEEWEWVKDNPIKRVSMEREPSSRDRWLSYEEEERLLSVSPQWLRELIIFSIETGCRRGEMLSLEHKDTDLFKKVITIFGSKTGEMRTIPLTQRALEILFKRERVRMKVRPINADFVFTHPTGKKINIHTLRSAFERALKKDKIEGFRWHDLRHSYASRLAQAGVDPYTIQKLMGHKTFATTQRYSHHCVESLRRGIECLEASKKERLQEISTNLAQSQEIQTKKELTQNG